MKNPFKPSFGSIPPVLIGRDDILEDFLDGLRAGVGDPFRSILFTGARGVGKSVMLTELEGIAGEEGFITVKVMTSDSLLEDIYDQALKNSAELLGSKEPSITSLSLPVIGGGIGFTHEQDHEFGWTTRFQSLSERITNAGSGIFIAVDEIHRSQIEQLRKLFGSYQIMMSSGLNVAVAASGLSMAVSDVLNDDVLTFLRRATHYTLAEVSLADVEDALAITIRENERLMARDDLKSAAYATRGYPFMIQLVGYHIWRQHPGTELISSTDVAEGVAAAKRRLGAAIHAVSLRDLSDVDRTFLAHMAIGKTPVTMSDMTTRMGVTKSYVNSYKNRLLEAGIIEQVARGKVDFAIPYLKDYLEEHMVQKYLNRGDRA
jgi:hypothetical protein